jgi:uncharacterized RDD family membrane protein YckC
LGFEPEAATALLDHNELQDDALLHASLSSAVGVPDDVEEAALAEHVPDHVKDFSDEIDDFVQQSADVPEPPRMYERIAMRNAAAKAPAQDRYADDGTNLIEFPRAVTVLNLFPEELAESITTPRILDVPDALESQTELESAPPPLATIQLDDDRELPDWVRQYEEEEAALELPLQVAPLGPRIVSGAMDAVLVLTAAAVFSMIVLSVAKFVPQGKSALAVALLLPATLWAAYHYIFLVFGGTTPGLLMAQLELSSFEGCVPLRRTRASRALAMVLSCVSLGLGFAWAMVDEDSLGWHDRITRTYLRQS